MSSDTNQNPPSSSSKFHERVSRSRDAIKRGLARFKWPATSRTQSQKASHPENTPQPGDSGRELPDARPTPTIVGSEAPNDHSQDFDSIRGPAINSVGTRRGLHLATEEPDGFIGASEAGALYRTPTPPDIPVPAPPRMVVEEPILQSPPQSFARVPSPERPSLMQLAGAVRNSDMIHPPFNIWEDVINAAITIGKGSESSSPISSTLYDKSKRQRAPWYELSAVRMIENETIACQIAYEYAFDAGKMMGKLPKKVKHWAAIKFLDLDFRLQAVEHYANSLVRDVNICRNKCGDSEGERRIASNAKALADAAGDLRDGIVRLRETIAYNFRLGKNPQIFGDV
ncbi:hypothetical protein TWF481_000548 [Arthrobotrys musiformis]|uniref:Uncharacterized protein n=1 Tax=Arthrobotrys musiformis TaxID=47236 RepID=A0AAV9WNU0_9PEZI